MHSSLTLILHLIETYKYLVLFPVAVFEGPIVTVVSGFLVAHGFLSGFTVYILIIIADTIGDALHYLLGLFLRDERALRILKIFNITKDKILHIEAHFKEHPKKSILFGKLFHGVGGVVQVAAGVARMPFYEYIILNIIVTLPKTFILLSIGFVFGSYLSQIDGYFTITGIVIFMVVMGVIIHRYDSWSSSLPDLH